MNPLGLPGRVRELARIARRFDASEDVLMRSVELATAAARLSWMSQSLAGDLSMVAAHARQAEGHNPAARSRLPVRLAARAAMAAAERGHLIEARRNLDAMTRTDGRPLGILEPWYWWAEGVVARAEGRLATAAAVFQRAVDGYSAMNIWALAYADLLPRRTDT